MTFGQKHIKILTKETIDKIAAGEVVERPASLVKELVENSIDAGASRIEVEIMGGGTSFIRVTDNGMGMTKDDAKVAILRHATSKISSSKDLLTVSSMGFRGEALPTIASVSRFKLITRSKNDSLGTKIFIEGEKDPVIDEIGCNFGTTVQVEDLFFNTPARKKFLKTNHTEGNRISDFLTKLALAYPEIAFRFIKENRLVMSTDGTGDLKDTIVNIYGKETEEALLPLNFLDHDVNVKGYITKPSMIRSSRMWQTFVVNRRIVMNKALAKAVDNAYHSLIPKSGHPFVLIDIKVPSQTIDINVHPQKSEIKFEDEGQIFKAIYHAVLMAVQNTEKTLPAFAKTVFDGEKHYTQPNFTTEKDFFTNVKAMPNQENTHILFFNHGENSTYLERQNIEGDFFCKESIAKKREFSLPQANPMYLEEKKIFVNDAKKEIFPLGQIALCYIVATDGLNLYIIDQHAAHERILYDKFSKMADAIPSQELLMHLLLKFSHEEISILEKNIDVFKNLGFHLTCAGKEEFRLSSIPCDIPVSEAECVVREIISSIMELKETNAAHIRHLCLATTACRAAVKAGDELNTRQMQILLDELAHTLRPYTCPHGRPTILRFSEHELAKMFKRTGF